MHNPSGWPTDHRMHAPVPPVLRTLARDCLDDLDTLVERYVDEVARLDNYEDVVDRTDLRDTGRTCYEMLLRLIGGLPVPDDLLLTPVRLGRRRAHQGVPLDRLLQAIRMDFRVLWNAFLERTPAPAMPELTEGAVRVWEAVEYHTVHAHAAYLDEVAVLARERAREKATLIGRLLSSDGRDPQLLAQTATLLQVDIACDFAVVVAPPESQARLREVMASHTTDRGTHLQQHHGMFVLITALPPGADGPPTTAWLEGVPCAVGPVAHGLAQVPDMVRVTEAIAAVLEPATSGPVTLADSWMPVAVARLGPTAAVLADSVLAGLEPLPAHERERLLEAVTTYCDTGSATAAARELYCHRNTVLNRLTRFAELTGYHPTRPAEAATVLFALHCARPARRPGRVAGSTPA
ncbi:helix-turn-helix domain-containing protein [Streptomyces sp. NPDC042319]|uniref:PucR family transcriptional regulator n=1 Tax=Streptomyces sp. NPDC042319 TaxID=3154332 RepID=UPI00340F0B64